MSSDVRKIVGTALVFIGSVWGGPAGGALMAAGTGLSYSGNRMAAKVRRETRDIPLLAREAPIVKVDAEKRTFELIWTTGARVRRYDSQHERFYFEELSLDQAHVRMERLQSGKANLLNAHSAWSLESILGVVTEASLGSKEGRATVRFSKRAEVQPIVDDVRDGIISNVSCGYAVYRYLMIPPKNGEDLWVYRAVDWMPCELSLVPIPADAEAGVQRGARATGRQPCEFVSPEPAPSAWQVRKEIAEAELRGDDPELIEHARRYADSLEAEDQAAVPGSSPWDEVIRKYTPAH